MIRSYHSISFSAARVAAAKRGRRVSVCLPARDEEATVGSTVETIRRELVERHPVVDELVVVDDGSTDGTATIAARAGATVVAASGVLPEYGCGNGKGQAMWRAVHVTSGELIVFCDADVVAFDPAFVLGLVGPLVTREDVTFVKGFYNRPLRGLPGEGGRVTELMARPVISTFFPHLAELAQPLSGEVAAPRHVFESVPFAGGYGVDLGLLIDVTERFGSSGLVQCDLGTRVHRNRSLRDLGPQALSVLQTALRRVGPADSEPSGDGWTATLVRPGLEPAHVSYIELPALLDVPAYRKSA